MNKMKPPRKVSPARSQGTALTPRHRTPNFKARRSLSVGSARSNASGRLTAVISAQKMDSFVLSPLMSRRSILSDNTEIGEPKRKSWYKKLGDNSRDIIEVMEENKIVDPNNIIEELDIEVLSQEKKSYTMDLPDSSDSESINSIVIPQRKLFTQKENLPQKKFGEIISNRETLAKLDKQNTLADIKINAGPRELFENKARSKPIFPAALLDISLNKTATDKTKEIATVEPKTQVRNIFGHRATKRKNIFTNFIVSESEDEIPEIQAKVFGFQKKNDTRRRGSSSSRVIREPSPTSSIITDIEMEDWKMLPSSTMVENQLEIMMAGGHTPKKARLSKLTEDKESETGSNATKHSVSSKDNDKSRKSKTFIKEKVPELEKSSTRNNSHISQGDNELHDIINDKSRKSKTFTKEKASELEKSSTRNKSNISQGDNELHQITNDKSRKSKTFTKEKVSEVDTSKELNISQSSIKTRSQGNLKLQNDSYNASKVDKPTNTDNNIDKMKAVNKSKSKSILRSPKDKNTEQILASDAADQVDDDEDFEFTLEYENNDEENNANKDDKSSPPNEKISTSNMRSFKSTSPSDISAGKTNRSLQTNHDQTVNKVIEESAELETTQKKIIQSIRGMNKSQVKSTSRVLEEDKMEIRGEYNKNGDTDRVIGTDQTDDVPNNSNLLQDVEVNIMKFKSISLKQDALENRIEHIQAKHQESNLKELEYNEKSAAVGEEMKHLDHEKSKVQNEVETEGEQTQENIEEESDNDEYNSEQQNKTDNEQDLNEVQNESLNQTEETENKSREEENNYENEDQNLEENQELNESQAVETGDEDESIVSEGNKSGSFMEQNEETENQEYSEVQNSEDDDEQNISKEIENNEDSDGVDSDNNNESNTESADVEDTNQTENKEDSGLVDMDNDSEQNISQNDVDESDNQDEDSDSDRDNQDVVDSDNDSDNQDVVDSDNDTEPNISLNNEDNECDNQDENQVESDHGSQESEEVETANLSPNTTGRNINKNDLPEEILHNSNNHMDSFTVQGRNTSVRTEIIKNLNIRPSLASTRESTGFSDSAKNSSAEGSGWDSHRTTRKTLRQTFGKDFTPRKSLRALVMEKSAKRKTAVNEATSVTAKFPLANSTELPEMSNRYDDDNDIAQNEESSHQVSLKTRQTTLEMYLQNIRKKNMETRLKIEEAVKKSLNAPQKDHLFKVPAKPMFPRRPVKANPKKTKSPLFLDELPAEVIEDLKYKPPKRFQPSNAPWITKRLYKFLETKLEPKYDYKARIRAEKLVENIYHFAKEVRRRDVASSDAVDVLKHEMARLDIVKTHFEFYEFFHQFMPREVRVKVVPDVVNNIPLPRRGIFADIL